MLYVAPIISTRHQVVGGYVADLAVHRYVLGPHRLPTAKGTYVFSLLQGGAVVQTQNATIIVDVLVMSAVISFSKKYPVAEKSFKNKYQVFVYKNEDTLHL